jgi:hypothetical protein
MVLLQKWLQTFGNAVQIIQQGCHVICSWVSETGKEYMVLDNFTNYNTVFTAEII